MENFETILDPSTVTNYKFQETLDQLQRRRKSKRFLDYFKDEQKIINETTKFLNTVDVDDDLKNPDQPQVELVQGLVELRKQKWNLKLDTRRIYLQQLDTFKYLLNQKQLLDRQKQDLTDQFAKVTEYRRMKPRTLDPHQMSPEERQQDQAVTQAELDYANIFYRHKEGIERYRKEEEQFRFKYMQLTGHKRQYETVDKDIQNKRQKLDDSTTLTIQEVENYILSAIEDQKKKYTVQLDAIKAQYEPFHCTICTETIATCTFPCCYKGVCKTCVTQMTQTSQIHCPFCRHQCASTDIIEMQF